VHTVILSKSCTTSSVSRADLWFPAPSCSLDFRSSLFLGKPLRTGNPSFSRTREELEVWVFPQYLPQFPTAKLIQIQRRVLVLGQSLPRSRSYAFKSSGIVG
jgi:hypothetical protein